MVMQLLGSTLLHLFVGHFLHQRKWFFLEFKQIEFSSIVVSDQELNFVFNFYFARTESIVCDVSDRGSNPFPCHSFLSSVFTLSVSSLLHWHSYSRIKQVSIPIGGCLFIHSVKPFSLPCFQQCSLMLDRATLRLRRRVVWDAKWDASRGGTGFGLVGTTFDIRSDVCAWFLVY